MSVGGHVVGDLLGQETVSDRDRKFAVFREQMEGRFEELTDMIRTSCCDLDRRVTDLQAGVRGLWSGSLN